MSCEDPGGLSESCLPGPGKLPHDPDQVHVVLVVPAVPADRAAYGPLETLLVPGGERVLEDAAAGRVEGHGTGEPAGWN